MKKLAELNSGDIVLIQGHSFSRLDKVLAMTKTQIKTHNQGKFNIQTGREVGSSGYTHSTIVIPTQEQIQTINKRVKKQNIIRKIKKCRF